MAVEVTGTSRRFGSTDDQGILHFADLVLGTYQIVVTDPLGDGIARPTVVLDEGGGQVDLGDVVLDEARPTVVSIVPSSGAASVPGTQPIVVTFSEPVMASTVNTSSMLVATLTGPIAGSWSVSADGRIATFVPATPFGGFSQVNVQVTTAVQDRVGRPLAEAAVSGYLTADSVPPSFASISPAGGATGVAPGATVRVAYGEAINPAAFVTPAIEMRLAGAPVAGQIAAILNNTVLVFTPASPLQANATYSVVVQPAADVFGNVQPQGAAFLFSTIDTLAPAIQQLVADRTTAVEGSVVSVVADLGSATDVASVEFMVNGTVVRTDMQAPYDASIPVTTSLSPSFSVSARAADLAGNISSPVSVTIAVQTDSPPTVQILSPADGGVVNSGSSVSLRVLGTDDRGVSRLAYQTSGQLTLAGAFVVSPAAPTSEVTFNISLPATTAPGPLTLRAAASDESGASSPTASITLTVADASVPTVQILSPAAGASVTAGQIATVMVSAADNGTLASIVLDTTGAEVFSATHQVTPGASTAQATFQIPLPIAPSQTSLNVAVRSRDVAGNESAPDSRVYTVIVPDTMQPALTSLVTASGSTRVLAGETVTLRATVSDNVGVTALAFQVEGGFAASGTAAVAPPVVAGTADLSILIPASTPNGALVTVRVRASDAASNLSEETSIVLTVGDTAAPVLTILSPTEGAAVLPGQTATMTVHATDDTAIRRVVFAASGAFTASLTREVEPPAAIADVDFPVSIPIATAAGPLVLTAEAFDVAGNTSGVQTRTLNVTDIVAPSVQITSPAPASAIDPREPLSVVVSATDALGVTEISFNASGAAASSETRTISPASPGVAETFLVTFGVQPAAGGSLTLSASARDAAGNVGAVAPVVVQVLDFVAPAVAAITPANGATGVDPQAVVSVEFSEPMNGATLTPANLLLVRGPTPEPVGITVSPDGRSAILTPVTRPLALNTEFTLTIAANVADAAGNLLGTPYTSTFRTASPDTTAPRVQTTSPAAGAAGVGLTVPIDVTFTEPVDPATVTPQSFRVSIGGSPVAGTRQMINSNGLARFVSTEPLPTDTGVVVELTSAITDAAGNALADSDGAVLSAPWAFTFATGGFGITSPAASVDVIEGSSLILEARASAALGVASVVFTVNGEAQPAVTSAPFARTFSVPSAASTPTLTIVASARNGSGAEIATDTRTVNVVVGLLVTPSLTGIPLGGSRTLRFSISSPIAEDLSIQMSAGDAALVSFPVNPAVLPAGQTTVDVSVHGEANGNTAVFGASVRGTTVTVVSVSPIVAGQIVDADRGPSRSVVHECAVCGNHRHPRRRLGRTAWPGLLVAG